MKCNSIGGFDWQGTTVEFMYCILSFFLLVDVELYLGFIVSGRRINTGSSFWTRPGYLESKQFFLKTNKQTKWEWELTNSADLIKWFLGVNGVHGNLVLFRRPKILLRVCSYFKMVVTEKKKRKDWHQKTSTKIKVKI